jgi:hypothetical protein
VKVSGFPFKWIGSAAQNFHVATGAYPLTLAQLANFTPLPALPEQIESVIATADSGNGRLKGSEREAQKDGRQCGRP